MYPSQRPGGDHPPSEYPPHRSPAQTPGQIYSPTENRNRSRVSSISGAPHSPQYNRGYPTSPVASRVAVAPSHTHDRTSTGYYDPIMDGRERALDHAHSRMQPHSPVESSHPARLSGDRYGEPNGHRHDGLPPLGHLPVAADHRDEPFTSQRSPPNPPRASNPMSMSNLLSDTGPAEPAPTPVAAPPPVPHAAPALAPLLAPAPPPAPVLSPKPARRSSKPIETAPVPIKAAPPPPVTPVQTNGHGSRKSSSKSAQDTSSVQASTQPARPLPATAGPPDLTVKDTEEFFAKINAQEENAFDDPSVDIAYWENQWTENSRKRTLKIELKESNKRQRRRNGYISRIAEQFTNSANEARDLFIMTHEREAEEEVRSRDIEDEKERKKDMQRKRRRERTLQNEKEKHAEAVAKLEEIEDQEERSRLMKDVMKAGKKIRNTEDLLQGRTPVKEVRVESPKPDKAEAAAVQANDEVEPVKGKKGAKGYRPRKSKEQKLAEKESAAAGQAYIDRGDELPPLAPKEEARLSSIRRESTTDSKDLEPKGPDPLPYTSKGYIQIYDQIWKDLAKNNVNKAYRIRNQSLDIKQSNLRKTAQLASKEAKRWQLRTNKSTKDVQARAKRSMREMLTFWKRNERDERDQRKMAEKQELENARKAEADREANRQKRKLNFLISQTELYSHFIGKKVKTAEAEGDGVTQSAQTTRDGPDGAHEIDLPDSNADLSTKVTNFEDLDFDAEDETALRQAAMANAQNAVKEAQDRARAFNNEGKKEDIDEDGEMNFQNPTSLGTMDIAQPKMLTCQLKEYQLKGLNWLVNLYEQGINGILADEMGLGKTVQSISVMAYLAEYHNIWGPFLVIAPASTLHNWQQEISKFVPTLKVLPYWGNAKDRKILRKFWDRKHITYTKDSPFHVLVTSYQLVVQDTPYFQKIRWQYMILDEAQAIKSSQSSRWKALLGFHCRNRLLLTGTPIQNNMQELWALLHFIMPSLFDSHDEFSEWFSKDIESHAQSNTKLNEDQLRRLHMILKPFMLRRVKKHVQKELGDKVEEDVYCDLTYRQRAIYSNLRNKISFMDLIEKAAVGDDQDTATLMNLVMQFRKVCNHPDLFERAEVTSPMSMSSWAETASFMREGFNVNVSYSVRNMIEYWLPKKLASGDGRIDLPGPDNPQAGWRNKNLHHLMSIWNADYIHDNSKGAGAFSWLRFVDKSASDVSRMARSSIAQSAIAMRKAGIKPTPFDLEEDQPHVPAHSMLNIVRPHAREPLSDITEESHLQNLFNIARVVNDEQGLNVIEKCAMPKATAPPIELVCPSQQSLVEKDEAFFNVPLRRALYPISTKTELALLEAKVPVSDFPVTGMLPAPESAKQRYTNIQVPSMRRFVTDSGKLAKLDQLLKELKKNDHRVLLYFQMTRMIDMMEEYLTYRNYRFCRLDGSTKLEDRRDTVSAFQSDPEIFIFLLSTRAGGLGINLTSADTVIFYDSDWNPTIDSQAMDRAHRLGQTKQVTVYRLITRGTIEERIRKRALQKEEVQRVVISGGAAGGIDFNARSRENRTKDIAMWLADDDQAAEIEKKEAELAEAEAKDPNKSKKRKAPASKRKEVSMDDMYHEGEGKFDDDNSNKPSGAATPVSAADGPPSKKRKGVSKKAKTMEQRLALADGGV